jgi:hypothetical protein
MGAAGTIRPLAAVLAAVLALAAPAEAARPDLRAMTCREAAEMVARRGAVVMTTGDNTFQRFVASRAWCDRWQATRLEYHPARDTEACGLPVCYEPMVPFDGFGELD